MPRHTHTETVSMDISRVVSPEISGYFLRKISGNFPEIYSYFSGNFRKIAGTILQGTLPPETFQITAHLLTTALLKGFYSSCGL